MKANISKKVSMYLNIQGKNINDFTIEFEDQNDGTAYFTDGKVCPINGNLLAITKDGLNFDWILQEDFA